MRFITSNILILLYLNCYGQNTPTKQGTDTIFNGINTHYSSPKSKRNNASPRDSFYSSIKPKDTIVVFFRNYSDYKKQFTKKITQAYYVNDTIFFYRLRKLDRIYRIGYDGEEIINAFQRVLRIVYDDGNLIAIGKWDGNSFYDDYSEFYPNGKLLQFGKYDNSGLKIGEWKYYSKGGGLDSTQVYKAHKLIKTIK